MESITEENIDNVDWSLFDSDFIKIEMEPIDLTLKNWKSVVKDFYGGEEKAGIKIDVIGVNGEKTDKVLESASKRLINALKPFLQRADKMNQDTLKIRIYRIGEGKHTQYNVKEI